MTEHPGFQTSLQTEILDCGRLAMLMQPLIYLAAEGKEIIAPAGFITDFASVPRVLWSILPPFGPYSRAAVIHDYLYVVGGCERSYADAIFLDAMKSIGVNIVTRRLMYWGVRCGGGVPWRKNRQRDMKA
jgi:hypothetical protein